jgi:hypothetical protein
MLDPILSEFVKISDSFIKERVIQELKYIQRKIIFMSEIRQISVSKNGVSKLAILALAVVFAAGLFVVGFDNGHIVNFVFAEGGVASGVDPLVIHEFTHDMRHAAGFPCH